MRSKNEWLHKMMKTHTELYDACYENNSFLVGNIINDKIWSTRELYLCLCLSCRLDYVDIFKILVTALGFEKWYAIYFAYGSTFKSIKNIANIGS